MSDSHIEKRATTARRLTRGLELDNEQRREVTQVLAMSFSRIRALRQHPRCRRALRNGDRRRPRILEPRRGVRL